MAAVIRGASLSDLPVRLALPFSAVKAQAVPMPAQPPAVPVVAAVVDSGVELAALREQARVEGYALGLEQGRAAGRRDAEAACSEPKAALGRLAASARGALREQLTGSEDVMVEIVFQALLRLLGEALGGRDGVVASVRQVIAQVAEREPVVVRVAPADHAMLLECRKELLADDERALVDLVPDDRVALGGCLVETGSGTLDGRLETQLQRFSELLLAVRRAPAEPHA